MPFDFQVVANIKPDGFTPKIVKQTGDYLYAEFEVGFGNGLPRHVPPAHC